jgi:hypothetical protein
MKTNPPLKKANEKLPMLKKEKYENKQFTPRPNIEGCEETGEWADPSYVEACKECVIKQDYYDPSLSYFFCGGKCMSDYDMNKKCALNSLVAKNISQCSRPCVQTKPPSLKAGCVDEFDCQPGFECRNDNGKNKCMPKPELVSNEGFEMRNNWRIGVL